MAKAHNLTDETKRRFRRLDLNFLAHFFRHFEVSGGHNLTHDSRDVPQLGKVHHGATRHVHRHCPAHREPGPGGKLLHLLFVKQYIAFGLEG